MFISNGEELGMDSPETWIELQKEYISDKDVYDFVLDWKPHWKGEKEFEVCETIHNMAMLSLMKIAHSQQLMDTMLV